MTAWPKASQTPRLQQGNPNASAQSLRLFRRSAPYPSREERSEDLKDALDSAQPLRLFRRSAQYPSREERSEDLKDALGSYKELEQKQNYSGSVKYDGAKLNAKPENTPADRRKTLYQKFYRQVQEDQTAADCVIISVTSQCLDYPKSLNQCLQERGLSVEMLYLQAESGLTQALQDVRGVGSPLCILVEQTNVALSSCTVIIFSEPLKIHRNMPKEQAMDFVAAEHRRGFGKESKQRDPADIASQASQLLGEFLDREKIERHLVPSEIRQSLQLLSDGVHVYAEELEAVLAFVRARQEHLRASNGREQKGKMFSSGPGKPPPLLPTPLGPPQCASEAGRPLMDCPPPTPMPLLPSPGSHTKTKPPPLLSLQQPPSLHNSYGGSSLLCSPLMQPLPPRHQGPRGSHAMRGAPPSLKSSRPPLLSTPGIPRLSGPRH
ncbi:nuclear receptor coactivator 5 isoform X1 [Hippocampus zosterae]|uniref:nuclear receptor coactivator 5 isoform X1 n=1 Tax=Hippocampus zosterae TaxID=109293 RepID=UPI00223CB490|nr:nuclear receptor coactivator 5 isoform X1 [Hippocampus zosterae]